MLVGKQWEDNAAQAFAHQESGKEAACTWKRSMGVFKDVINLQAENEIRTALTMAWRGEARGALFALRAEHVLD